ncbi:MAG: thymidine kinase [Alkalispirochaetaceae bacterium]
MSDPLSNGDATAFLKSLGLPSFRVHPPVNHFDFTRSSRRILVMGPMGSGKTEYSSRVWRDSQVALKKSRALAKRASTGEADRRRVFFVRSALDRGRFREYPEDALAYRGGYERLGESIAEIDDSYGLERLIDEHPDVGSWVIDEASFYDERLAYVMHRASEKRGLVFICPTLILNFRRSIFNQTAQLLLEVATDIFPLTAYCEHHDCLTDSLYTYRYYTVEGEECPALYFDPLIIVGGDTAKHDSREPDYATRCDEHHYLPGKEYTYLYLKPLGVEASRGNLDPLAGELAAMNEGVGRSMLEHHIGERYQTADHVCRNALKVPCLAERALCYLFVEQNLLSEVQLRELVARLDLDREYLEKRLSDNGRPVYFRD